METSIHHPWNLPLKNPPGFPKLTIDHLLGMFHSHWQRHPSHQGNLRTFGIFSHIFAQQQLRLKGEETANNLNPAVAPCCRGRFVLEENWRYPPVPAASRYFAEALKTTMSWVIPRFTGFWMGSASGIYPLVMSACLFWPHLHIRFARYLENNLLSIALIYINFTVSFSPATVIFQRKVHTCHTCNSICKCSCLHWSATSKLRPKSPPRLRTGGRIASTSTP